MNRVVLTRNDDDYTRRARMSRMRLFPWRVESGPNNYASGPSPGSYGATSPWNAALYTILIDTNGDGYRDFAFHLDGSSGSPPAPIDFLRGIWSNTKSQSIDYVNDPTNIQLITDNPSAFIDRTPTLFNRFSMVNPRMEPRRVAI